MFCIQGSVVVIEEEGIKEGLYLGKVSLEAVGLTVER